MNLHDFYLNDSSRHLFPMVEQRYLPRNIRAGQWREESFTIEKVMSKGEREQRLKRALYQGDKLTLESPEYRDTVSALLNSLLQMDSTARDITVHALGILDRAATARIIAHEEGIVAGIAEFAFLYKLHALNVAVIKHDGDAIHANDVLLTVQGTESRILSLERTGLNLLQRMSGIAT